MAELYTEVEVQRLIAEATAPLLARIGPLETQLVAAKNDASTSSKRFSSDIAELPLPDARTGKGQKKKRRPGGQP